MTYIVKKVKKGTPYYYEYESFRVNGETKHKMVRYLGKSKDLAASQDCQVSDIKSWGDVQALCSLANEVEFNKNVNLVIHKGGGVESAKLLLILAINRILDPCSKNKVENWYRKTALDTILGVDAHLLSAQNLCSFLDYLTPDRIDKIERNFARTLKQKFHASTDCIIYDITSTYTFGTIDTLSRYGYSRDHREDLEQINIGLAVTEKDYFPIMHQVFEGNVPDVVTLPGTAKILDERCDEDGIPKMTLIHDRGFLSEDNIKILDGLDKFDFVCGAKRTDEVLEIIKDYFDIDKLEMVKIKEDNETILGASLQKELYGKKRNVVVLFSSDLKKTHFDSRKKRLDKSSETLKEHQASCQNRNKSHDQLIVSIHEATKHVQRFYKIEVQDHPESNSIKVLRKEDLDIDQRKLTWIEKKVEALVKELKETSLSNREIRNHITDLLGSFRKYYDVTIEHKKPHSTLEFAIDQDEVNRAAEYDGYHVLISSNLGHSMNDIISLYDSKDGIEKAFYTIKHPIRINPIRHWTPQRVRGHVYVCVVAYLLYSVARYRLKLKEINISVLDSMDELNNIKLYTKTYRARQTETSLTQISDRQSELLATFFYQA
jgi:transposase